MDELEPMTPVGDVIVDEGDKSPRSNLPPKDDGTIVLAQLGANPSHVFASNPLVMPVDVENPQSQRDDENLVDAPVT